MFTKSVKKNTNEDSDKSVAEIRCSYLLINFENSDAINFAGFQSLAVGVINSQILDFIFYLGNEMYYCY